MWIEQAIVVAIVLGAAAWSARFFWRAWRGKSRCGCGSGNCPAAKQAAERMLRSIESGTDGSRSATPERGGGGLRVRNASE